MVCGSTTALSLDPSRTQLYPRDPASKMNLTTEWDMVFGGEGGTECEDFVMGVRKQALARGMKDNDKWTAQRTLVGMRFDGTKPLTKRSRRVGNS